MALRQTIQCDNCREIMQFQDEIRDSIQSYRCFNSKCIDRWAIVTLNSRERVVSIQHTDRGSACNKMLFASGLSLGVEVIKGIFKRK